MKDVAFINSIPLLLQLHISPTFSSNFKNLVGYRLGICKKQSPYQTIGIYC
jgi:hypothetical protein